jgi:branched-chain amino acid transport system substrate-binding protein
MSRPEPSDNISDYAPRGPSEFYRHARVSGGMGEGSAPKGDLSRLRQSLGPEPEIVHVPQPTRRLGWFASGFAIALVVGVVAGWLVISQFPSVTGKSPASSTKTAELAPAKSPEEANAPGAGIANTARAIQSSAPSAGVPAAAMTPQPANSAPARLASAEPAPFVRGVTDTEIRFGISAPFSGPAKELARI